MKESELYINKRNQLNIQIKKYKTARETIKNIDFKYLYKII